MDRDMAIQTLCSNGFGPRAAGSTIRLGKGRSLKVGATRLTAKRPGTSRSFGLEEIHFAIGFLNGGKS